MDNITLLHQFMVKACLASAKEDREAWVRKWEEIIVIEDMDYSSMRLVPLFLHRNIESGISTKHDKRLKIIYKHWWLRTRHIIDQLKKVHSAINNRGIGVVVIKGASIITRYELPELRPMSDFDLLIKPGEINACLTILKDMGYSPNKPLQYRILLKHKSLLTEFVHGLECVHAVTGTKIDLHWRIGSLCSWQFTDDLWSHLDNYTPIPHARKPQLAYEAFMTITHALVNGNYNNLNWIIDVDLLNKSTGSSFWEKARQLAVAEKKKTYLTTDAPFC